MSWRGLPRLLSAFLIALGAGVLIGWWLGIEGLTRVYSGMITMKPNAALGFLLSGLALWSIRQDREPSRVSIGLSMAVVAIGGLTLLEYLAGINLGIDEILHAEPPNGLGSLASGRMHPATALDFLLLGLASILLAADREHRAAQALILMASLIAGSTMIGYFFGVRNFVGLAVFNQMALHTTVGMMALAGGLLLARSRSGLMVSITDDGPGGMMARRLIPIAVLTPFVISGLTMMARDHGVFDESYGSAVRVTLVIAIFVGCIWRSSHLLHRIDQERQRVEAERIEGERRFRFLAESMPQIVWISRADGEIQYLNRRWFDYTGQDPGRDSDWRTVLHPEDLRPCLDRWERSRHSGETFEGEYRYRRLDGSYRWHLIRSESLRDESGRVVQWIGTATDINDRRRAGEERYRSLVEATTAIVWNTPNSGYFEVEQPGWGAFTGQSFDELKGRGWLDAIHPEDRGDTDRVWAAAVENRSVYQLMHRVRRHDGEYRHMIARAVPLLDDDGAILEWFGVHTDVHDQERAHEEMRAAKEAAEAATRAKGEFLANMSHEIRTPMNGVLGMTELALATDLNPRQREYLGLVKSSADALLTVIDDILDFSKIEAGKLALEPIPLSTRDLVTDTLRSLALRAHQKGLELACRIAPEVPETVLGDPGRLRQVLLNLVGNALKFTERGEVVLTVDLEPDPDARPDSEANLRFSIADTGIGIPVEKRALIFVPFEQADGSTTRKYGGTGLGLAISIRLIELMGGRIWVEENPGGGSIFRFTARLEPNSSNRSGHPAPSPIVLDGLRILIVDDNRTNRMILEEVLSQWGCRPIAVEGGLEALAAMSRAADRSEPFSLVLLDMMMPEMDGCDLAKRIRSEARYDEVKLMMLTSGGGGDLVQMKRLGIGVRLAKPIRQSELLGAILDMVGAAPEPLPSPPPESIRPETTRRLRVLVAEDHPINQKVASRMLQGLGHEVTIVGNGRLALEALASSVFDVVLMDVQMPEMDGFEALKVIRLRESAKGGHIPILAVTAHAMAGDRERCLDAGFDGYLAKPIQGALLATALAAIGNSASGETAMKFEDPPDDRPAFDLEGALDGLGGDERFLREILGLFLEDAPGLLAGVEQGVEAGDAETLRTLGHTLAGSASHFAAPGVVATARRLEAIGKSGHLADAPEAARRLGLAFDRFRRAVVASKIAADYDPAARS